MRVRNRPRVRTFLLHKAVAPVSGGMYAANGNPRQSLRPAKNESD